MTHKFEQAGLGRAPFRFIGVEYRVGPIRIEHDGITTEIGAPGQPMGVCAYCAQGIAECCVIQDADGKRFIVGNVCVAKTGDRGLVDLTKRAVREFRTKAAQARQDAKIARARVQLAEPAVRERLAQQPHPYDSMALSGKTRLDWAEWMMRNAGRKGKCEVAKFLEVSAAAPGA